MSKLRTIAGAATGAVWAAIALVFTLVLIFGVLWWIGARFWVSLLDPHAGLSEQMQKFSGPAGAELVEEVERGQGAPFFGESASILRWYITDDDPVAACAALEAAIDDWSDERTYPELTDDARRAREQAEAIGNDFPTTECAFHGRQHSPLAGMFWVDAFVWTNAAFEEEHRTTGSDAIEAPPISEPHTAVIEVEVGRG